MRDESTSGGASTKDGGKSSQSESGNATGVMGASGDEDSKNDNDASGGEASKESESGDATDGMGASGNEDSKNDNDDSGGEASKKADDDPPACEKGETRSCGSAPMKKLGACAEDTAICENGEWVGCSDSKGDDTCELGNDNSCNGKPNEGCPCVDGDVQDCGHPAVGLCEPGTQTCKDQEWGPCEGEVGPAPRDCSSSEDNDCDGNPDDTVDDTCRCPVDGMPRSCDEHPGLDGNGPCTAGSQVCELSEDKQTSDWGECTGAVGPASEDTCDPEDDADCNGIPNEGCPCVNGDTQSCGHAAVGICKPGTSTCADNDWGTCEGGVNPKSRDCSSPVDNDCDGKPDNTQDDVCRCVVGASPQSCGTHPGLDGNGPCKAGTRSCGLSADKTSSDWGTCSGSVGPQGADSCDPGNDNDCDGTPNEGCSCVNGEDVPCACGPPATCVNGTVTSCTVGKVTLFRDADGDGFGNPSEPESVCPATSGYASNADDCDDGNENITPGYSDCSSDMDRRWCASNNNGVFSSQSCAQGCSDGACRNDGTIGVPGMITCATDAGPLACPRAESCCSAGSLNNNTCGLSGKSCGGAAHTCDGPNDCPSGEDCYIYRDRAGVYSLCTSNNSVETGRVCDPLAPSCANCTPYSDELHFIYSCK